MTRSVPRCAPSPWRRSAVTSAVAAILVSGLGAGPAVAATPGQVALVSHHPSSPTTTANGGSAFSAISGDGAFVAFTSTATDLVPGQVDGNNLRDVFLYERATGAVRLVSHVPSSPVTTAGGGGDFPRVSADGSFVVFYSFANDLVEGQSGPCCNLFLFERATGKVSLVSHAPGSANTAAGGVYFIPTISPDGGYVGFSSMATNLVAGQLDSNQGQDTFLFERTTGEVSLVSHVPGSPTTTGNGSSGLPSVSAGGAHVSFTSGATDLVEHQRDRPYYTDDIFLLERLTGRVTLVSHLPNRGATTGDAPSYESEVSADGAFVAFDSAASDLVNQNGDASYTFDLFLFERATGRVTLVSHAVRSATTTANGSSHGPFSMSSDGALVTFASNATDLVPGQVDTNPYDDDVFLFERATGKVTLVSHTPGSATTVGDAQSHYPSMSADGSSIAFISQATNLVERQRGDAVTNIFLFDRASGAITLVSHTPVSATTSGSLSSGIRNGGRGPEIDVPRISGDGGAVAFVSLATNLVPHQSDTNGDVDVFVFDRLGSG